MPLWTTATDRVFSSGASKWGWAFSREGLPWVAHRVWAIATSRGSGCSRKAVSRDWILPASFQEWILPASLGMPARPAESYPRYSRSLSPLRHTCAGLRGPMYPKMPHMGAPVGDFSSGGVLQCRFYREYSNRVHKWVEEFLLSIL